MRGACGRYALSVLRQLNEKAVKVLSAAINSLGCFDEEQPWHVEK